MSNIWPETVAKNLSTIGPLTGIERSANPVALVVRSWHRRDSNHNIIMHAFIMLCGDTGILCTPLPPPPPPRLPSKQFQKQ